MACEIAENMKIKYYEQITLHSKRKSSRWLMVSSWILRMAAQVLNTKKKAELNGINNLSKPDQAILENYDVIMVNNKQTLVKISKELTAQVKKVIIPLESSFELVLNAHLYTRHGNSIDMYFWVDNQNVVVSKLCIPVLRKLCLLMNKNCITGIVKGLHFVPVEGFQFEQDSVTSKTTKVVSAAMLDMTSQPDGSFGYILVYTDLRTQFIQLRPIRATDMVNEIAMELIKIFCDFSPPKIIKVQPNMMYEFSSVVDKLNNIFHTNREIMLKICSEICVRSAIVEKLTSWMVSNGSCWSIGCHFVQWDMNNTKDEKGTGFKRFFGMRSFKRKTEIGTITKKVVKQTSASGKYSTAMKTDKNNKTKMENVNDVEEKTEITRNDKDIIPSDTVIEINSVKTEPDTVKVECFTHTTRGVNDSTTSKAINCTTSNVFKYVPSNISNDTKSNVFDYNTSNVSNCSTSNDSNCATSNTLSNWTTFSYVAISATSNVPATDTQASIEKNYVSTKERLKCHICGLPIETEVYFCCVCKKSLHFYCGAIKRNSSGEKSICFMCL